MALDWNTCLIIIDESQTKEAVASALRRLAGLIKDSDIDVFNVVALRAAADEQMVGTATFLHDDI